MFGAQVIKPHETYLSLPSLVGRSKPQYLCSLETEQGVQLEGKIID